MLLAPPRRDFAFAHSVPNPATWKEFQSCNMDSHNNRWKQLTDLYKTPTISQPEIRHKAPQHLVLVEASTRLFSSWLPWCLAKPLKAQWFPLSRWRGIGFPVRQKKAACLPSNYPQTKTSLHWPVYLERCPPFFETSSTTTITRNWPKMTNQTISLSGKYENHLDPLGNHYRERRTPLHDVGQRQKILQTCNPLLFHRIPVNRLEQHWATPCCIIYSCTIKNYRSLVSDTAERNKYLDTLIWYI